VTEGGELGSSLAFFGWRRLLSWMDVAGLGGSPEQCHQAMEVLVSRERPCQAEGGG